MFKDPQDVINILKIDKHALDDEFVRFPHMLGDVGAKVAQENAEKEWLKLQMEKARSRAYTAIKREMDLNKDKYTEKLLEHEVQQDADYTDAVEAYADQRELAERWERALTALTVKGQMLKQLAGLYATDYWASNSAKSVTDSDGYHDAVNRSNRKRITEDRTRRKLNKHR